MVECGGLENRCTCKRTEGSNPSLSATFPYMATLQITYASKVTVDKEWLYDSGGGWLRRNDETREQALAMDENTNRNLYVKARQFLAPPLVLSLR